MARVAIRWPAKGMARELCFLGEYSVLLLNSVPRLLSFYLLVVPDQVGEVTEVRVHGNLFFERGVLPLPRFAEHHNVVSAAERIFENSAWFEKDFRVFSLCLVRR